MENLVNLTDYTMFSIVTFLAGCLVWGVVYIAIIRDVIKTKLLGIPAAAVCGCFAWEINWGLIYHTDMGNLFQWMYFMWFFLDCFIVFCMFRYGKKQIVIEGVKKYFVVSAASYLAIWFVIFYLFIGEGYDDSFGALTGYLINIHMSLFYVAQKLKQPEFGTSRLVAVGKFIGTGLCTFACFQRYPDHKLLMASIIIFALIDIVYIIMVYKGPKHVAIQNQPVPVTAAA